MQDQGEPGLSNELQGFQTRLDMTANFFKQIAVYQPSYQDILHQVTNALQIYGMIPADYRLQIEVDEKGYEGVGGKKFQFAREIGLPKQKRYLIIVKAPMECYWDMPENTHAIQLTQKDLTPTGPTALELTTIRKTGFDHGPYLWPENVLAMKIVPNTVPLPH
jgi:hypothetical protein